MAWNKKRSNTQNAHYWLFRANACISILATLESGNPHRDRDAQILPLWDLGTPVKGTTVLYLLWQSVKSQDLLLYTHARTRDRIRDLLDGRQRCQSHDLLLLYSILAIISNYQGCGSHMSQVRPVVLRAWSLGLLRLAMPVICWPRSWGNPVVCGLESGCRSRTGTVLCPPHQVSLGGHRDHSLQFWGDIWWSPKITWPRWLLSTVDQSH
jgi:hypothetical protein